ncbi:hypothetical protein AcV5_003222 [Taiwanofungus camphoratus]|nr:hypothetical protein AcV5_003222 [Antrodia cinnamomea]KAI0929441.1 hypothetical protein AcV7_005293 [Antrodia cinnamomea]
MNAKASFSIQRFVPPRVQTYCGAARLFSATALKQSLTGTVAHHNSYVLLHTHRTPIEYPPKVQSQLLRALTLKARGWGGLVNLSWAQNQDVHPEYKGVGSEEDRGSEVYRATAFSVHNGQLDVPEVSMASLDSVAEQLEAHALSNDRSVPTSSKDSAKLHLYVCTHGPRDCRCGETGGEVFAALQREIEKRGLDDQVMVGSVGHVGGHKYAANVLVFPYGDWLGTLQEVDVPRVLDEMLQRHAVSEPDYRTLPPLCPPFWRGRMGLDKEEQIALHSACS